MGNTFQIREITEPEPGEFAPRGAVKTLWQSRDFETIVAGPAETGKTWGCLQYADALLWKYPGAQGVIARKSYSSLIPSAVRTYQRIIGPKSPIRPYGGEYPAWFDYPNGSRLWLAGLDNPGKALSSERDFIYTNQTEELVVGDWETLLTRVTGRGAVMPYTRMFGDANPGPPKHWIKERQRVGSLRFLESRHVDNPTLYDDAGNILPQGVRTMAVLDSLTGLRRSRLRDGLWVAAEGVIYDGFDPATHVISSMPPGWESWRKFRSIDFGYTHAFVCQWWAVDGDGRMYLYRELYRTKTLVEDIAADINRYSAGERYETTISDHDGQYRLRLSQAGIVTVPADKGNVVPGIQRVAERLRVAPDGRARLYLLASALIERDALLTEARQPASTAEEFESYVWAPGVDGKPGKEEPVKINDDGMDAMRYAVLYADRPTIRKVAMRYASC